MTRVFLRALLLVVAFAASAQGAIAEDHPAPVDIGPEHLELLPLTEIEWVQIAREHPDLAARLKIVGERYAKVAKQLAARNNQRDAGSRKLAAQLERDRAAFVPLMTELKKAVEPMGISEEVLRMLERATEGPYRIERYALRVARFGAGSKQVMHRLPQAVEGALLATHATVMRLEQLAKENEDGAAALLRARDDARLRATAMQKRFWRVVDCSHDLAGRLHIKRSLPTRMTKMEEGFAHLYLVEGMTPAQGAQVTALFTELEQETAADKAAEARITRELGRKDLSPEERADLNREQRVVKKNQLDTLWTFYLNALEVYTPLQIKQLRSIMPMLTTAERSGDFRELAKQFQLTPKQQDRVRALKKKYEPLTAALREENIKINRMAQDYGEDSPQQDMMNMMRYATFAKGQAANREAAGVLFTEILRPEQVLTWVLGAGG